MSTPDASQYTFIHKLQVAQECEKYIAPEKLRVARQYVTRPTGIDTLFGANALKSNKYLADLMSLFVKNWVVSTFAGDGSSGNNNGPGASANFSNVYGVAVDLSGNVYVADTFSNRRIRKITPDGVVSPFAGDGTIDQFNSPYGVAVDLSGNVYVADTLNHRIQKITPEGVVSNFAGNGSPGYTDGPGVSAQFNSPHGVAVDTLGNVYVADSVNNIIRKITPEGVVSPFAGTGVSGYLDGPRLSSKIRNPYTVAVDSFGNVYFSDYFNHRIRKIDVSTGIVSTLAGDGTYGYLDGPGASSKFQNPFGLAVDKFGNVYVADSFSNRIRKITSGGVVSTLAGSGVGEFQDGAAASAKFNFPHGVAVDSLGNVYVTDTYNKRIRKITYS